MAVCVVALSRVALSRQCMCLLLSLAIVNFLCVAFTYCTVVMLHTVSCYLEDGYFMVYISCSERFEAVFRRLLEGLYNLCECMNVHCACPNAAECQCVPYWFVINQ